MPRLLEILLQSSQKPIIPKPKVHKRKIQTFILLKSHHNKVFRTIIAKIKTPPIVGMLSFFLCVSGVNSRAFERKNRREMVIKKGPNIKKVAKELSKEATARTLT